MAEKNETKKKEGIVLEDLERYRLGEKLGRGGMGEVYKAYDLRLKRDVALKILWTDHPDNIRRFSIEAQSQAKLKHDHICQVYDVGKIKGKPYIAMQFIDGQTVDDISPSLTLPQKVKIMKEIAAAVHEAHRFGLIHRDLKPTNIMVEQGEDGVLRPYVLDFGLAKEIEGPHLTATGFTIGTPNYMSPEQVYGDYKKIDRRSDVFGLGATFYEFLTGERPFTGESHLEIITKVLNDNPVPPQRIDPAIPKDLDTIVMKCLEKEQHRRYDSARALAEDLQHYIDGEPIEARQAAWTYRLMKKIQKNKTLSAVTAAALILIAVFAGMGIKASLNARKRALLAQNLGQELKEIESTMRISHLLPLHNTGAEKAIVIEKMAAIEDRIRDLGRIGRGPGHYALGRGYLVLDKFDEAYSHLLKAWENNYREPHAAFALARALGALYKKELEFIDKIPGEKIKKERRERAEKEFKEPIIKYLKVVRDTKVAAPEYIEALLAYYEGNFEKAIAYAQEVQKKIPWFYEARVLIAEIYRFKGSNFFIKGVFRNSKEMLEKAEKNYLAALEIGRSDPLIYAGIALVNDKLMEIAFTMGNPFTDNLKKAFLNCENALKADADNLVVIETVSIIHTQLANFNMYMGKNPENEAKKAITNAKKGLKKYPDSIQLYNSIGSSYDRVGQYKLFQNLDPREDLKNAVQAYKTAIKKDNTIYNLYNNIGSAYWGIGYYELIHGLNPTASCKEGILHLRKAVQIDAEQAMAHYNLGLIRWTMSRFQLLHGKNPIPIIKESLADFENALKLNPNDALIHNGIGMDYSTWSEYELQKGMDPNQTSKKALETLKIAVEKNPYYVFPVVEEGNVYWLLARYRLKKGGNPLPLLAESIAYLNKAAAIKPDYVASYLSMGQSYIVRALYYIALNRSPEGSLINAERAVEKALKFDKDLSEAFRIKGECNILRYEWRKKTGQSPGTLLTKSLQLLERSVTGNPDKARVYTAMARCYLLRARAGSKSGVSKKTDIQKGLQLVTKALEINPGIPDAKAIKETLTDLLSAYNR